MIAALKGAGLGVQVGAGLGGLAAAFFAFSMVLGKIDNMQDEAFEAGMTAHALADAKAAEAAQNELDARIRNIEIAHQRRVQELEDEIEVTRRAAAESARADSTAFNAELVRLRNEARARRNASRADNPTAAEAEMSGSTDDPSRLAGRLRE